MPREFFWVAILSLARLLAASIVLSGTIWVLVAVDVFGFLDIFAADARNAVVASMLSAADACCDTLGDETMVLPLTLGDNKLGMLMYV